MEKKPRKACMIEKFYEIYWRNFSNSVIQVGFQFILHIYICPLNNEHVRIFWINLLNDVLINSLFWSRKASEAASQRKFCSCRIIVQQRYTRVPDLLWNTWYTLIVEFFRHPPEWAYVKIICDSCNTVIHDVKDSETSRNFN